jgi:hypothetical protein
MGEDLEGKKMASGERIWVLRPRDAEPGVKDGHSRGRNEGYVTGLSTRVD